MTIVARCLNNSGWCDVKFLEKIKKWLKADQNREVRSISIPIVSLDNRLRFLSILYFLMFCLRYILHQHHWIQLSDLFYNWIHYFWISHNMNDSKKDLKSLRLNKNPTIILDNTTNPKFVNFKSCLIFFYSYLFYFV